MRALAVTTLALLALGFATRPAHAGCQLGQIAELPVTMAGLRPQVTARIEDTDVQFTVDSGAFYSLLTPEAAAELKLRLEPAPYGFEISGVGGSNQAYITTVRHFTLAGAQLHNIQFLVAGNDNVGGVGVIGQNILRVGDVEYDFANGLLRLFHPSGDCRRTEFAYWAKPDQAYSVMDIQWASAQQPYTVGKAFVNGREIRVLFDTGASTSLLSLHAAARVGVKPGDPGVAPAGFAMGVGHGAEQEWIAPFASFKIGDEEIKNTHLRITALSGVRLGDMLLGADFFLSHHIYVASSKHQLFFTYNGGPVFNLTTQPLRASRPPAAASAAGTASAQPAKPGDQPSSAGAASGAVSPAQAGSATTEPAQAQAGQSQAAAGTAEPTDAAGFGRRGAAYAARRDFPHALADLTRACKLDPAEPQYFYERARVYLSTQQRPQAMTDLDRVILLKPDHVPALVTRAQLRFALRQPAAALTDLDAAAHAAAKQDDIHLLLGQMYQRAGAFPRAVAEYALWITAHDGDPREGEAFYDRCRARAFWGQELDQAVSDCSAALRRVPEIAGASVLEVRALVRLRRGELDRSLRDYNASLQRSPRDAWSLYGRGLAKIRKGATADGQIDLAAARALQPRIEQLFRNIGIVP